MAAETRLSPEAADIFARLGAAGRSQRELADALQIEQNKVTKVKTGERRFTAAEVLSAHRWFTEIEGSPVAGAADPTGNDIPMVGIQHIDMAYGLGTTFAVDRPEIEVLQFPKEWIETITFAPPALLTWTRGKGDSMEPTIRDGDLILLDRSQRAIGERDAMWAFTIGEEAAIKRLRRQGDRCQILSDNKSVPPDEQNLSDMNIVGRVVFVGSRK